jgi:hypothetical protein
MGINGRLDADENHSFIGLGLPDTNKGVIFYGLIVTGYPLTDIGVRPSCLRSFLTNAHSFAGFRTPLG